MLRLPSLAALAAIAAAAPVAHAQQGDATPETIVRSAERALQDDSLETVTARWRAALERDSTDPAATLGLATVARQTYDFERADSLLQGLLARSGTRVDGWTVRARLGIYRVANARGEVKRADALLRAAMAEARQLDDRPAQIAELIGFTNTRSGDPTALYATLDTILALLPPCDGRDRAEYLCRLGLYHGIRAERDASELVRTCRCRSDSHRPGWGAARVSGTGRGAGGRGSRSTSGCHPERSEGPSRAEFEFGRQGPSLRSE